MSRLKMILLFTVVLTVGSCYGVSEEKTAEPTTKVLIITEEFADDYGNDTDYVEVAGRSLKTNINAHRNRTMTVRYSSNDKDIKDIKKMLEKQEQRRLNKLYVKIIGGVIAVFVIGGISICYRAMCKKKRSSVLEDTEETVPSLPPGSCPAQPNSYPQQQIPYPPHQTHYLPPLAPYPPEPEPYPPQPVPYPSQPASYPAQLVPYPPETSSYPMQSFYPYRQEQTTYPSPSDGSYVPLTKM